MIELHQPDEEGKHFTSPEKLEKSVRKNRVGWLALRHKTERWWVGDDEGVHCYETRELAMLALTIVWRMDGGKEINFNIERFRGANQKLEGVYETEHDGETALKLYEETAQ